MVPATLSFTLVGTAVVACYNPGDEPDEDEMMSSTPDASAPPDALDGDALAGDDASVADALDAAIDAQPDAPHT